ncbi:hypothetical protein IGB42_03314 [Andreprevotia sp. IGB-42]|uniref:hypothetical protein n=1 Tax=Andreprevotia sp. IGB-42 TaxID=2497473 RepID=UPI001358BE2C|nr:hypothetical protein [Andreprevotia sp. IGB-42]KAF0812324.1 hypothetical protein IGB42_03314 [Andreprevotia sp. IGB-42]
MTRVAVRLASLCALALACLQLTGCAQLSMSAPSPSAANIQKARKSGMTPVAIAEFVADPGKAGDLEKPLDIRSNALHSPVKGSYAAYLAETLRTELHAAGLNDPASSTVVRGTLTRSSVSAPVGTGKAELAARFFVIRKDGMAYERELSVSDSWDSDFIGVSAIPAAIGHYQALYRTLVGALLDDPDFQKVFASK